MGGLNARKGISAIMNRLMSNAVMSQLNMTGAGPQKKAAFEKSTLCQIILGKQKPKIVIVVLIPRRTLLL